MTGGLDVGTHTEVDGNGLSRFCERDDAGGGGGGYGDGGDHKERFVDASFADGVLDGLYGLPGADGDPGYVES